MSKGFTLIEMMVVIVIIGVLMTLAFPAIHTVRETALALQCRNNLGQIGLAAHNYHDANKHFPAGCKNTTRNSRGFISWPPREPFTEIAWSAFLLPHLGEKDLYRELDTKKLFNAPENEARHTSVAVFLCPSCEEREPGSIHYAGICGERISRSRPPNTTAGTLIYDIEFRFQDITDGNATTLFAAEDCDNPDGLWIHGRNILCQSGSINDPNAWTGDNEIRSRHPHGANCLFVDGRAVFLSEEIDLDTLAALCTRDRGELVDLQK